MEVTRKDISEILQFHLEPIKDAISKLEQMQEKVVEILTQMAAVHEQIRSLRCDIDRCMKEHDGIYVTIRAERKEIDSHMDEMRKTGWSVFWDIGKLIIAAIIGMVIGRIGGL